MKKTLKDRVRKLIELYESDQLFELLIDWIPEGLDEASEDDYVGFMYEEHNDGTYNLYFKCYLMVKPV